MSKRICVTGAAGKAGGVTTRILAGHGYDVLATDVVGPPSGFLESLAEVGSVRYTRADLTDYGQAVGVLGEVDAVAHLANIPAPGLYPPVHTIDANTTMNNNVFLAAAQLKLDRVVWTSSETTLGLDFTTPPRYAPLDEDHYPLPTSTYSLSKVLGETAAEHISAWSGIPFVALRLSNVMLPDDYARFPSFWPDASLRRWNLWSYIDARDVGEAFHRGLTADVHGASSYIIAAADTVMDRPSADLLAEEFPGVKLTRDIGEFETLQSIDRAREVLGWEPQHSWRTAIGNPDSIPG